MKLGLDQKTFFLARHCSYQKYKMTFLKFVTGRSVITFVQWQVLQGLKDSKGKDKPSIYNWQTLSKQLREGAAIL